MTAQVEDQEPIRTILDRLRGRRRAGISLDIRNELLMTEYAQLRRQVPALYATIAIANIALAVSIHDAFPFDNWIFGPLLLSFGILVRLGVWIRRRNRPVTLEKVRRHAKGTTITAVVLGSLAGIWSLQAFFGAAGPGRIMLPVLILMASLAVVNCVASMRMAAVTILALGVAPVIFAMLLSGESLAMATGSCCLVVALLQLRLIFERYRQNIDRIELQHQMLHLANTDMLTDLPNRRAFFEKVEIRLHPDSGTKRFALALLDLDGFKQINDRLGHQAGDALLRTVAERLRRHADANIFFGRIGGDEFAILFDSDEPLATISSRATGIMASLAEPCLISGRRVAISASLGIAQFPDEGQTMQDLYVAADKALYAAKSNGNAPLALPGDHARMSSFAA